MWFRVQLGVPRAGGVLTWGAVAGDFGRRLAGLESATVIGPRVDRETRRGRDFVRVVVVMTVEAGDVAGALLSAWRAFLEAASDDAGGWDMAAATAEVRPEGRLSAAVVQAGGYVQKPGQRATGLRGTRRGQPAARR